MGDNSVKNSRIKILKSHAHLHIIGRKSTKFQVNPMKDVGGVAETRSLRRMDGITHTQTDEGHFDSPPPPTSGDKKGWQEKGQVYQCISIPYLFIVDGWMT